MKNNYSIMIMYCGGYIYAAYSCSIKKNPIRKLENVPSYTAFFSDVYDKYDTRNKSIDLVFTDTSGFFVLVKNDYVIFDVQTKEEAIKCISKLLKYYKKEDVI